MWNRRSFSRAALAVAGALILAGSAVGCGGSGGSGPAPIPASESVIHLPADSYLHRGAATEWWWHVGTLQAADRAFGFEINSAGFQNDIPNVLFSQLMLSDLKNQVHYQRTTALLTTPVLTMDSWAEFDVTRDWLVSTGSPDNALAGIDVVTQGSGYSSDPEVVISGGGGFGALAKAVRNEAGGIAGVLLLDPGIGYASEPSVTLVGGGGSGATAQAFHTFVSMKAAWGDPTQEMSVKARLVDQATGTPVLFDLTFSQQGPPFIVWGTGVKALAASGPHLQANNYYYSLTRLQASGTVTVAGQVFPVTGVTWMDHEYGGFGNAANPVHWVLQDTQFNNGICVSNYAIATADQLQLGRTIPGNATVQKADGTTYYVPSRITPFDRTWTSPDTGVTYFMRWRVEIPSFGASYDVTSLMDAQEFPGATPVYEGVAIAAGTFEGKPAIGTAWNEQDTSANHHSPRVKVPEAGLSAGGS
jgi:predicted secreted hydrolase